MTRTKMAALAAALSVASLATSAWAGEAAPAWPQKSLRFIVPASASGPSDIMARLVAERLGERLGQPVVVENRPGGSMMLGTTAVVRAEPDGYTLLFTTSTPIVMTPFTLRDVSYDVKRDLRLVAHLGTTPLVLYAGQGTGIQDLAGVAKAARAAPGGLSYGSYGVGSSAHVLGEYYGRQAGVRLLHVPYKGVAPLLQDVAGGQVALGVADVGTAAGLVQAGRIRPIAVTGDKRSTSLPNVPTFAEQGIQGMEPFSPWWGIFVPAATPPAVIERVSREVEGMARDPAFMARMRELGADVTGVGVAQAGPMLDADLQRWQGIIGSLGDVKFE